MCASAISPLHAAVLCGVDGLDVRLRAYMAAGADVDLPCGDDGSTPLMSALVTGQIDIAAFLISRGSSVNRYDALAQPVLKHAVAAAGRTPSWHVVPDLDADFPALILESDSRANAVINASLALLQERGQYGIRYVPFLFAIADSSVESAMLQVARSMGLMLPVLGYCIG
jgi:ankyrin repeat protein